MDLLQELTLLTLKSEAHDVANRLIILCKLMDNHKAASLAIAAVAALSPELPMPEVIASELKSQSIPFDNPIRPNNSQEEALINKGKSFVVPGSELKQ